VLTARGPNTAPDASHGLAEPGQVQPGWLRWFFNSPATRLSIQQQHAAIPQKLWITLWAVCTPTHLKGIAMRPDRWASTAGQVLANHATHCFLMTLHGRLM